MSDAAHILVAAPSSGCGKTTVCRGLMAALVRRGLLVQPFKCGSDYIDTKFHTAVCSRPSVNLDSFMATPEHIRALFARYSCEADVCVVEGMMGLFDGYDRSRGSTAEIAEILDLPVLLVVDARSAAYSVAALLRGFAGFRQRTRIAGVVFNRVGSGRHADMLREACRDAGLTCFGCLPTDKALEQRERYLGLDFSQQGASTDELAEWIERYVDVEALFNVGTHQGAPYGQADSSVLSKSEDRLPSPDKRDCPPPTNGGARRGCQEGVDQGASLHFSFHRSVILRNAEAFSFIYTEHIDLLKEAGQVTFLDPEADEPLPEGTDFLYLPGGYPERHAVALSRAKRTIASIRSYIERGGRALAECGGMIYLSHGIHFDEEPSYAPLCGVLPFDISCRKADRRLSLGYRQFTFDGRQYRGHEFHYTQIIAPELTSVTQVYDARMQPVPTPVFRYKNLLASYIHLYWT